MAHKKIESPEILWMYFEEYRTHIKSHPYKIKDWVGRDGHEEFREKEKPLTMVGFENHLSDKNIIGELSDYFENADGRYADFKKVCKRIRNTILQDHQEGAMTSMYHHGITARLNGWVDKIENTNKNVPILSIDPLDATTNNLTP